MNGSLGSTRRVKEIAESLAAKLGVKINVYSPYERDASIAENVYLKSVPSLAQHFGLNDLAYRSSKVVYYNKYLAKHLLGFVARNSSRFLSRGLIAMMKRDRVSALQAEHDISLYPAIVAARELGIPLIADLHNITAEELVATGVLTRGGRVYQKLQDFVGECLAQADHICVVSEYMADYVSSNYGIEKSRIAVVAPAGRLRRKESAEKVPNHKVVYSGMATYREHVDLFVRSIAHLTGSVADTEFLMTDKGDALGKVKKLAGELEAKLSFFWFPSEEDLFEFLSTCSLGALPSNDDEARRLGTPIKLFDYMSVGLPVVANDVGGWSRIIDDERIGMLTKDDPDDFGSAIGSLLENDELRSQMSLNCLKAVSLRYNWDKSIEPLTQIYEKFV